MTVLDIFFWVSLVWGVVSIIWLVWVGDDEIEALMRKLRIRGSFGIVWCVSTFAPFICAAIACGVESSRAEAAEVFQIASDPKAWVVGKVGDSCVTASGVGLLMDLKLVELRDEVKGKKDAKTVLLYGRAIEALERERAGLAEMSRGPDAESPAEPRQGNFQPDRG